MKKFTLLFMFIGMITLQSCAVNEDTDNFDSDTISEVIQVTNVDFNSQNDFSAFIEITPAIYSSDMVLVYRLDDITNSGQYVWKLIPQTYYFPNGDEIDYNFDFTTTDVSIYMDGNFDLIFAGNEWTQNQIFRIVIIPGFLSNKGTEMDFSNYDATIEQLGLTNKSIKKISL